MNILIVGCGKVGSQLAQALSHEGHDVSVVDSSEERLERLSADFTGLKTHGIPIDQDVLRSAGVESCDALAAVSSDDSLNIMVCELARTIFHVETVLARIYDPQREEVFASLGLHTVCPTNMTVAAIRAAIIEQKRPQSVNVLSHTISFTTEEVPRSLDGEWANDLELTENQSLYGLIRKDQLILFKGQQLRLAAGDTVILATAVD